MRVAGCAGVTGQSNLKPWCTRKALSLCVTWSNSWGKDENQPWHGQGIFFITRLCENLMNWASISICSLEQLRHGFLLNNNSIWRCCVFFFQGPARQGYLPRGEGVVGTEQACSCCSVNKWLVGQVWRRVAKVFVFLSTCSYLPWKWKITTEGLCQQSRGNIHLNCAEFNLWYHIHSKTTAFLPLFS